VVTARVRPSPLALVRAAEPSFLIFVLALAVGPNLTYVGSLATLLWRRIVHAHDETVDVKEFVRLGVLTVTPVLLASTVALWLALHVV
jgi:arsenical pump membrane protein